MRFMQTYDTLRSAGSVCTPRRDSSRTEARLVIACKRSLFHHLDRAVASMFRERTYGGYDFPFSAPLLSPRHHGARHHEKLLSGEKPAQAFSL
jgi:hypothetical protein